jgi:hypothetical protein
VCGGCGSGRTIPFVATDQLGKLYPDAYNAYALPTAPLARAAATGLFRWRFWRWLRRPPLCALAERPPGRLLDVGSGPWRPRSRARRARLAGRRTGTVVRRVRGGQFSWRVHRVRHACRVGGAPRWRLRRRRLPALAGARGRAGRRPRRGPEAPAPRRPADRHASQLRLDSGAALRERLVSPRSSPPPHALPPPRGLEGLLEQAAFAVGGLSTSSSADGLPMSLHYRRFGRSAPALRCGALPHDRPRFAGLPARGGCGQCRRRRGPAPRGRPPPTRMSEGPELSCS